MSGLIIIDNTTIFHGNFVFVQVGFSMSREYIRLIDVHLDIATHAERAVALIDPQLNDGHP